MLSVLTDLRLSPHLRVSPSGEVSSSFTRFLSARARKFGLRISASSTTPQKAAAHHPNPSLLRANHALPSRKREATIVGQTSMRRGLGLVAALACGGTDILV